MAESEGLDENIHPLKTQFAASSPGLRSQICRKAAFSGWASGGDVRQARALMNSERPNLTVFSTGISNVCVRADSLSMVRRTTKPVSCISRFGAGVAACGCAGAAVSASAKAGTERERHKRAAKRNLTGLPFRARSCRRSG